MEIYLKHNIQNFIILAGYKKDVIIEYFNSTAVRVSKSEYIYKSNNGNTITILDTGDETLTGGRINLDWSMLMKIIFILPMAMD